MRVLITGASGLIGSILRSRLGDRYAFTGADRSRSGGKEVQRIDMARSRSLDRLFNDVDAVVDLAGIASVNASWHDVWQNNLPATINALEAATRNGVRRFVYASSNHVTGLYERDLPYSRIVAGEYDGLDPAEIPLIDARSPLRPDGAYAIGKIFGEAAARYFSEQSELSTICLRIGTVNAEDRPRWPREFATLLTHVDLAHLVDCALNAPAELGFGVYYGVSDNTWGFWDIEDARRSIGYSPHDNAERFRAALAASDAG